MTLASVVKSRRAELGISLQQLADRCGSTKSHMHEIEKGSSCNPTVNTICGLAAGLQMSAVALFREAMKEE